MGKYTSHTENDLKIMYSALGISDVKELYKDVPESIAFPELDLPEGMTEADAEYEIKKIAAKNKTYDSVFLGAGAYKHYIPAPVRELSRRSEFVTAYTPYQAEMSQGILQAMFEYQSLICGLTGMDVSNASHYDGATAAAEACLMLACRGKNKIVLSPLIKESTKKVIATYLSSRDIKIVYATENCGAINADNLSELVDNETIGVYFEQPNSLGAIEDAELISKITRNAGAKLIAGVYPISLGLLKKPSEYGADIVVGEGQPLGMPFNFGGAYLGFMAAKSEYMRKLPGRIVGETTDAAGRKAYVLTLQAREQHIRREKASSNICSNEAHCALTAGMYLSFMGKRGMRDVATACVSNAHYLKDAFEKSGIGIKYRNEFFNEFVTLTKCTADKILNALAEKNILGGLKLGTHEILWCATEINSKEQMDECAAICAEANA